MRLVLLAAITFLPMTAGAASTGAAFLNRPLSVRQMGMGNVATGENDILRAWSNPAVLAGQETAGEIALNGASRPDTGQSSFGAGAGYRLNNVWAVGLTFVSSSVSFAELDEYGAEVAGGNLSSSSMALGLTVARPFGGIRAGVTAKFVSESITNVTASGMALDAGLTGEWGNILAGVSARNIGPALRKAEEGIPAEALPLEMRAGVSYRIPGLKAFAGGEYVATAGRSGILGAGFGWAPLDLFTVRAGYTGIAMGGEQEPMITAGFSGHYAGIGIDYAAGLHALGLAHRVSLSYAFGRSAKQLMEAAESEAETAPPAPELEKKVEQVKAGAEKQPAQDLPNVAVMDFTAQNVSSGDAAVISDMLRGELVKTRACNVIEKQNMDKILAEQAFQNSGCTSEECAVKLGKLLNVNKIVVGSFGKIMDTHILNIRVVNVESGKIVYGDKVTGSSLNELDKGISALAKRIAKQVR